MSTGGVISVTKASGNIYFLDNKGEEVLPSLKNVTVSFTETFAGMTLKDAVEEAKRFAIGALKRKTDQRTSGKICNVVVHQVNVTYKIKYGFTSEKEMAKEIDYKAGDLILKKGSFGREIYWVKTGIIEISKVEYTRGNVFGRAAFSDGIRKIDVYAKTDCTVISINKDHPDLIDNLHVILEKFVEEEKKIKKIRPKANLEKIKV